MTNPFNTSPLPAYLYLTQSLAATLDKVRYVVDNRQGLTVIYGDVGTGKSTVLRYLFGEYAARDDANVGLLPTPQYKTDVGLLRAICGEFGLPRRRSMLDQEHEFRAFLMEGYSEGKNCVVFIDEAQIIQGKVLELVRLLLNLETDRAKLIQIVLCGQLELRDRLRDPSKKALRSRIFITSTLAPLSLDEAREMIAHRCKTAGERNPFPPETVEAIWGRSGGVPRDILKYCGMTWHIARQNALKLVPVEAVEMLEPDMETA
jgi:general secretion pathway protein A